MIQINIFRLRAEGDDQYIEATRDSAHLASA
jgi:hypothetical protein